MRSRVGRRLARADGFTLVELMIVVVIVAILSLVLIPLQQANVISSKMSEGMNGVGAIRTALRTYAASHGGNYPVLSAVHGDNLSVISLAPRDLDGKYFQATDYVATVTVSATYTIRATLPTNASCWYEVNEAGTETKSGF